MSAWLDIPEDSDFSLDNIPFGVCSLPKFPTSPRRCVTAVGNKVVDLRILQEAGAFGTISGLDANVFSGDTLDEFIASSPDIWPQVRRCLADLFRGKNDLLSSNEALQLAAMFDMNDVTMHLPCTIGDYTDFYSSREHATNIGIIFRGKDNALQPNWLHLPVGYHGRASTVQVSGEPVVRPHGQLQLDPNDPSKGSVYGPCKLLDFELEVAFFVGGPPNSGPMTIDEAKRRIFGFCLMNDWSARDIQKWEYVPLGPFTSKNFATTISPWIVTKEALAPFQTATSAGKQDNPVPLEYLRDPDYSSFDVQLNVALQSPSMKQPSTICTSNFANLYWNAAQQLVHHTVTGCKMNPGDLLASGTISGPTENSFGSMMELSWKGTRSVKVGEEEKRKFLKDGDTVIMTGVCSKVGHGRVGFGVCSGKVLPSGSSISPTPNETPVCYSEFKLYSANNSTSSWSARIGLAAKGVSFELIPVDLEAGEHNSEPFLRMNPLGQTPVLEYKDQITGSIKYITQLVTMMEFLDQCFPAKSLLIPKRPEDKLACSEMVEVLISCAQHSDADGKPFADELLRGRRISRGLAMVETLVVRHRGERPTCCGPFCLGTFSPTIVDVCLIPQLAQARQLKVAVEKEFASLFAVEKVCSTHPWFEQSRANIES